MTRLLERLAFWRKKQPKTESSRNKITNTATRPIPPLVPPPPNTTLTRNEPEQSPLATFLVPDLDDIRPFVTGTSNPISMRDLLSAISSDNPHQEILHPNQSDQLNIQLKYSSMKSKRKRDHEHEPSREPNSLNQQDTTTICRATHLPLPSGTLFKKPRLITFNSNENITPNAQPPQRGPPSSTPQPILGLPPDIWYQILLYNQLAAIQALIPEHPSLISPDGSSLTLQSTNCIRPHKVLMPELKLALEAQKHRHSLIGICKALSPIARKAAWSTLVLGTPKMVDRIAQKFEADSQLATQVQTCIITLLPTLTAVRVAPSVDSPRTPKAGPSQNTFTPNNTPKQSARPSHPSVRRIQQPPIQRHTPPQSRQSLPLARQALIGSRSSAQQCERFHSVLIPSLPPGEKVATSRNTKLNSVSSIDPQRRPRSEIDTREGLKQDEDEGDGDGEEYLNEIVLAGSLPSLFLSLARSMKVCCVLGEERLGTRGLKSLSVLSGLLGNLEELYVEGGGQFNDLATLVDGLRSSTIRGKGAALRTISITGPQSTLCVRPGPPPLSRESRRIASHSSSSTESARSTLTNGTMVHSSASSLFPKPVHNHLSLEHLILGHGIPLTPERLHWLVLSGTGSPRGLRSLKVCLQAEADQPSLSSSVSSSSSCASNGGRRGLSGRALLSRTFERVGGSLEWLALDEDWSAPLTDRLARRVSFAGQPGEGVLEEPIAFCSRLAALSLPEGPLCSSGLLAVLPFTLHTMEIFEQGGRADPPPAAASGEPHTPSGFSPDALWLAHSQAALFGLKTVRVVADSCNPASPIFRKWKHTPSTGLDHLQRAGVLFRWISIPASY
ncbi:hypothetical protein PCANC_18519 [Puccinia coronata f. sp. avenae]|uniref:Uncharacterized protein n=1 Tax=Puccinia coronata f. sp. avenae TaxID=200324 RepID=A0A2N5SPV2_9BASI|nr:hypothetical protein PCANC_18519 [Puccinia coronata f. sp. avenae]